MDPRLAIRTAVEKGIEAVKAYKDLEAQFQLLDQGSSHPDLVALAACHEDMIEAVKEAEASSPIRIDEDMTGKEPERDKSSSDRASSAQVERVVGMEDATMDEEPEAPEIPEEFNALWVAVTKIGVQGRTREDVVQYLLRVRQFLGAKGAKPLVNPENAGVERVAKKLYELHRVPLDISTTGDMALFKMVDRYKRELEQENGLIMNLGKKYGTQS